jgi:23S rRNA pseudouridine1911/1915/1917 synthase
MNKLNINQIINEELAGLRLDQALVKILPEYSRSQIQQWILKGEVKLDHNTITKAKERVFTGQLVELTVELQDQAEWLPEEIPLNIIYEDESFIVIDKPAGLVVHPGAGNQQSTLVNALLYFDPNLKKVPRAGLIHRLDKDTSGLLVVARNLSAHNYLTSLMQQRQIKRIYHTIVSGTTPLSGTIDLPIGRHPTQRTKMSVLTLGGKPARTHFKLLQKLALHSYLEIELETGRTHQIRVHLAYQNHPVLGDPVYGKVRNYAKLSETLRQVIANFKRQALHAQKLSFYHPEKQQLLTFESALPEDFANLLDHFQKETLTLPSPTSGRG